MTQLPTEALQLWAVRVIYMRATRAPLIMIVLTAEDVL